MATYGGGPQRKPWQSHIDMYRKLPIDLMEGSSRRGSILSYLSLALMAVLLASETRAYFTTSLRTDLQLDKSDDPKIRLNFNITMLDLKCDWAVIDVVRWVRVRVLHKKDKDVAKKVVKLYHSVP